jgi:2-iminobutanoate/2-iminopropanoate deaminase
MSESAGQSAGAQFITLPGMSSSPLSAATILNGVIYSSGQVGRDPETGRVPEDFAAQVHTAIANLKRVLEAGGGSLATVLKTTVFLTKQQDFATMNELYGGYFPSQKPARSTLIVALADPTLQFEIEAIAYQQR